MNYGSELPLSGFVTPQWVRDRYKISNSTLYKWISEQHLPPPVRLGPRAVRFSVESIRHFEEKIANSAVKPR